MISVVIPTLDSEASLPATLASLVTAAVDGLVREVIVVDGGSRDATAAIADSSGARVLVGPRGRGSQLALGAKEARFPWLLFLHADTRLGDGWEREALAFLRRVDSEDSPLGAAAFRFALDDQGLRPRLLERLVALRCMLLRLPYGDQGLLIPKRLYQTLGGYRPLLLMEDVDLVRRLGRRRVSMLRAPAITSAERFVREGYGRRSARNLLCLALYLLRVPIGTIHRIYG
ncbi:MAG TPA: TIGR04283 family arsenosugar biosynthesis glycosyltransferase [Hyphomicrobiaceae bacterium]|jgi:rSAM/selenodomain-associated transferase 2|nr:TIGR04283 family arsenosugar biosynthesis glycosyltransferase [Hyphomicrobiaceae bacterium]